MLLETIKRPEDVKKFSQEELEQLTKEIREALLNRLSVVGGHTGPNLGVVELSIALHRVFNSPVDKFIFDVSHQSYTHKMLTGREYGFTDNERFAEITGILNLKKVIMTFSQLVIHQLQLV